MRRGAATDGAFYPAKKWGGNCPFTYAPVIVMHLSFVKLGLNKVFWKLVNFILCLIDLLSWLLFTDSYETHIFNIPFDKLQFLNLWRMSLLILQTKFHRQYLFVSINPQHFQLEWSFFQLSKKQPSLQCRTKLWLEWKTTKYHQLFLWKLLWDLTQNLLEWKMRIIKHNHCLFALDFLNSLVWNIKFDVVFFSCCSQRYTYRVIEVN